MNIVLQKPHSFVNIITNSSSEIFSILGNIEVVNEFINNFLKLNGIKCSGMGGDLTVQTFTQYIDEMISDGDIWFSEDYMKYIYYDLETYEEKFKYILNDIIKHAKEYHDQEINPEHINNMIIIDIDCANKELINNLKETFGGYINLT